jgi:tetratricopeptide (TPR) repeat protein
MQNSTRHPDVSGVSLIESVESEREEILRRSSLYLDLCSHFLNSEPEWLAAARRLRQSESFQESDALLAEAHERFPQSLELAAEYARSPRKRGDEEEAVRRWQLIASKFPEHPLVSAEFCKALNSVSRFDEADLVSEVSIQRFTGHLHVFIEYARTAEARRDWSEADRRWNLVRERFPDAVSGHLGVATALLQQQKSNEAEAVIHKALELFPRQGQLLGTAATIAHMRRDWSEAIMRWDALLACDPEKISGHEGRIAALRELGRLDEAEEAVASARLRFPQSVRLTEEAARLAAVRSDWDRAIEEWQSVRLHTPTSPRALMEITNILMKKKQYRHAELLLEEELSRFPDQGDLSIQHAEVAKRSQDWEESLRRWSVLRARFPDDARVLTGLAETLWAMKNTQRYIEVVDHLQARHPDHILTVILYARSLLSRNRAGEAVARLSTATGRWPSNPSISWMLNDARLQALIEADDELVPTSQQPIVSSNKNAELSPQGLFEQFESLGGDVGGCEFGLLQRRFNAELLGLLRWVSVPPQGLIDMLERRFQGLGDLSHTSVKLDRGPEYRLIDCQYEMDMHTFISADMEGPETLLVKLAKRQRYLGRLLLENLQDARRFFVYKTVTPMAAEQMKRLRDALKGYGDNWILLVRLAAPGHPPGSINVIEPGLIVGAVDRFSTSDLSVDAWTQVCRAAIDARTQHV